MVAALGVAGVCDLAWVVLTDRIRSQVMADRQAMLTASLFAGVRVDLPDVEQAVDDFAAALAAPPATRPADHDLRLLLGVA